MPMATVVIHLNDLDSRMQHSLLLNQPCNYMLGGSACPSLSALHFRMFIPFPVFVIVPTLTVYFSGIITTNSSRVIVTIKTLTRKIRRRHVSSGRKDETNVSITNRNSSGQKGANVSDWCCGMVNQCRLSGFGEFATDRHMHIAPRDGLYMTKYDIFIQWSWRLV